MTDEVYNIPNSYPRGIRARIRRIRSDRTNDDDDNNNNWPEIEGKAPKAAATYAAAVVAAGSHTAARSVCVQYRCDIVC